MYIIHDNTKGVFLYMFIFAYYDKDGDGLCRRSKRIYQQGSQGDDIERGQKFTKF